MITFVINRPQDTERLAEFNERWEKVSTAPATVFPAMHWPHHTPRPAFYARGSCGAAITKIALIHTAVALDLGIFLMLEDDVAFESPETFLADLEARLKELPNDWAICYIGAAPNGGTLDPNKSYTLAKIAHPVKALAFAVNTANITPELLAEIDTMKGPIGNVWRTLPHVYSLNNPLIYHPANTSTITGAQKPEQHGVRHG